MTQQEALIGERQKSSNLWDEHVRSVLVQLGLLEPAGLPVVGVEGQNQCSIGATTKVNRTIIAPVSSVIEASISAVQARAAAVICASRRTLLPVNELTRRSEPRARTVGVRLNRSSSLSLTKVCPYGDGSRSSGSNLRLEYSNLHRRVLPRSRNEISSNINNSIVSESRRGRRADVRPRRYSRSDCSQIDS
jgi:hypothetical protein